MMYDPNSKDDFSAWNNTANNENGNNSYTYVFSNGTSAQNDVRPPHADPPKKSSGKGFWIGMMCLTLFLCAAISFVAGFGGTRVAIALYVAGDSNQGIVGSPSKDGLYHSDPDSILSQGASEPSIYGSAGDEVFSISQVVRMVQDAVVVIDTTVQSFGSVEISSGSGVIISENGYIVTCNHVVENAKNITVTLNSGTQYTAAFVGGDSQSDLAILKIDPQETLTYAEHGISDNLAVGEVVVAIGNPLGMLGGTVTSGIISSVARTVTMSDGTVMTLLQTDAAINSGNSGGGLFNLDGQLIGIVNAKYESSEGLAFAIPIDLAFSVEKELIQYGYVRGIVDHGLSTVYISERDISVYRSYYSGLGITEAGVYVISSEFCDALINADRILSVNGVEIQTVDQLEALIKEYQVGDTLTVLASRKGITFTAELTLREYVPDHVKNELK